MNRAAPAGGRTAGFREDLARLVHDPAIRRLAERRAGSRELAEKALQETSWSVARVRDPETIPDVRAFFVRSLLHEINHQRRAAARTSVEAEARLRLLAETLVTRLERDRDLLTTLVPGRSPDHGRYRNAVVAVAKAIVLLLLEGEVTSADWNAVLKSEYSQWYDEPGQAHDVLDQRLSRARRDVQSLLQTLATDTGASAWL